MNQQWNAREYERLANPHVRWGDDVMARLELAGDETVIDAGCGTGRVTAQLLAQLPRGQVIGVDQSPDMIEQARERFRGEPRVSLYVAGLTAFEPPAPVDAVFSNATFHWIKDHDTLFRQLAKMLKPGGQLVAQCGGAGNVDGVVKAVAEVAARPQYAAAFAGWDGPWLYTTPEATVERLERAGFCEVSAWLNPEPVICESLEHLADYLQTIVLGQHLQRLPAEQHRVFCEAVAAAVIRSAGEPLIDYVRLNIVARRA